jgi:hypothetical protein
VQSGRLPEYKTSAERIATMDADVRELTAEIRKRLTDKAHEFTVTGWELDDQSWEMGSNGRSIVVSVLIKRPE